jgi:hypothetical protein
VTSCNVLRYTASLTLLILAAGIVIVTDAVYRVADQTRKLEVSTEQTVKSLPVELQAANRTINNQLSVLNSTVSKTSGGLTVAAASLQTDLSRTLAGLDRTTTDLNSVLGSVNKAVSNPDIPALVRDARQTVAITGVTMSHVRKVADVAALEAPATAASVNSIAASVAGITDDVHAITSDIRKPRPWWKKALAYVGDGAKIGAAIF